MKADALLVHIATAYINHGVRNIEPQLGQYYIAEYAHRHGFEVRVKKFLSSEPTISSLQRLLEELECDIVGFYVDCMNQWTIRRLSLYLKRAKPNLFIIIGGPQVTGAPHQALHRISAADIAIVGEGEIPFTQLLSIDIADKQSLQAIDGITYRDEEGNIRQTKSPLQTQALIDFPFPRRLDYTLDHSVIFDQISTGRGCIGRCAFCFEGSKTNNVLRLRPVEDVIEEIDYVVTHLKGQNHFCFLDDTFIINPDRTKRICQHMIERYDGKIKWFCEARVDILYQHLDLIPLLVKAGLLRVQLGGESGSQTVLDAYKKHMKVNQLKAVVKALYENGVPSIYINFIIGGAFETLNTFNETLELALELMEIAPGCAEVGSSQFTPYVGTPMYNHPELYDIKIIDKHTLSGLDGYMSFAETSKLNRYKVYHLFSVFEAETAKKLDSLCEQLSYEQVRERFHMHEEFGLEDNWIKRLRTIEAIDKYFQALSEAGFFSIRDLSLETIQGLVPHRTKEPISDGEAFYRNTYKGKYIKTTDLEESVLLLSSGKITFNEIVYLLGKKKEYASRPNLEQEIFDIYRQFDEEYLVVWKQDL